MRDLLHLGKDSTARRLAGIDSVMAPTVYVVAASAISLLVVLRMPETARMPLG